MEQRPRAILLKFAGTNCERETQTSLELAGFKVKLLMATEFFQSEALYNAWLSEVKLIIIPGGFSYGDALGGGQAAALRLRHNCRDFLQRYVKNGGCILGICNGFQILCRLGLLPGALISNKNQRFICKQLDIKINSERNVWFHGIDRQSICLPVAHGEGRWIAPKDKSYRIAMRYENNVNGSDESVAGLLDDTGRILGMMPHPERVEQGKIIFRNVFHAIQENLIG